MGSAGRVEYLPPADVPVSAATPFRALGDVSLDVWRSEFRRVDSPFGDGVIQACWEAARPVSALVLHLGIVESTLGRSKPAPNNWLGLKHPDGTAFLTFADPVACVEELTRYRWVDPSYKPQFPGVYMPREKSLRDFYYRYSPPNENPTEELIVACVERVNRWRAGEKAPEPDGPTRRSVLGTMVPWPRDFARRIVRKPPSGNGWDELGDRRSGMVGIVEHITDGNNTVDDIVRLFGPGGGRFYDALTEAVIGRDGTGALMNDPWSDDPMEGSGRTPWASGGIDGLEGPGIPFVQRFGANAVNHKMFAKEHCGKAGQRLTDPQADLTCQVNAVVLTREGAPWEKWPFSPKANGLQVHLEHRHFSTKSCPAWDAGQTKALIDGTRAEAKKLQTGLTTPAGPAPTEPEEAPALFPLGLSETQVAAYWGAAGGLKRRLGDGTTRVYPFDPAGPIGAIWLARARESGVFPAALDWWIDPAGWNFVTFGAGGDVDWVLGIPTLEGRADWRWVDRPAA
jgi:hypothetical protein